MSVISLVDADRQWFNAMVGLDAMQTDRSLAFCGHAIVVRDVFVVPDALMDQRFAPWDAIRCKDTCYPGHSPPMPPDSLC